MLLHVLHETAYDYVPTVRTAQHMAHLKPANTGRQRLPCWFLRPSRDR